MKKIILITGGERSGKSVYAENLALGLSDRPVYLATARIWDEEFRQRVAIHRERRGPQWTNIEEEKWLSRHRLEGRTVLVDCGSICKCIEHATGRKPDITLGKPDPNMLQGILHRHGLQPDEIAMVGDRIYTDIAMAHNAGAFGVLVLSGETTLETALEAKEAARTQKNPEVYPPDLIVRDIEELGSLLVASRR